VFAEDPRLGPGARGWWRRRVSGLTALAFIEDRATLPGGFTLTPGLAFVAADVSRGDEQVLAGSAVTPGLGAAWDATRDGLTVVRAGVHRRADLDVERRPICSPRAPWPRTTAPPSCRRDRRPDASAWASSCGTRCLLGRRSERMRQLFLSSEVASGFRLQASG
jgi:hypothetical protein